MKNVIVIALITILLLFEAMVYAKTFEDVTNTKYEKYVDVLSAEGIVNGFPDGTFKPYDSLTRAQFCKMIVESNNLKQKTKKLQNLFSDIDETHWAYDWICIAVDHHIIIGYEDGTFQPEQEVSYAEALTMLVRVLDLEEMDEIIWPDSYIEVATENGLLNEVVFETSSDASTRGDATIMICNAMDQIKKLTATPTPRKTPTSTPTKAPTSIPTATQAEVKKDSNCMVNGVGYDSLEKAYAGIITNQATIVINKNYTDTSTLTIQKDKDITIDMNGKTLAIYNAITNSGTLSIIGKGIITTRAVDKNAISFMIDNTGNLNISDATIQNLGNQSLNWGIIYTRAGNVNIMSGTLKNTTTDEAALRKSPLAIVLRKTGKINISGGTIETVGSNGYVIYTGSSTKYEDLNASITITGGSLKSPSGGGIINSNSEVKNQLSFTMSGGSIEANIDVILNRENTNGSTKITSGKLISTNGNAINNLGKANVVIGKQDNQYVMESPMLLGKKDAIISTSGFSFYDGTLGSIGMTNEVNIKEIENNYAVERGKQVIDGISYNTIKLNDKALMTPIDTKTGMINNDYFGIKKDTTSAAVNNFVGINEALQYASSNGISSVKMEKGNYCIADSGERDGIRIPSNMDFDMNGSTFILRDNNQPRNGVIYLYEVTNVKIHNGKIKGDRDGHDYTKWSEWGHGIRIWNCTHIQVYDMEIFDVTGDGINITDLMKPDQLRTTDIVVRNNDIHHCRRNNVVITGGDHITISQNTIHHSDGTRPMAGIDIERNNKSGDYEQFCTNIIISENKIYGNESQNGINVFGGVENLSIINNELGDYLQLRINHYNNAPVEEVMKNQNITVSGNKVIKGVDCDIHVTSETVNEMIYRGNNV